MYYMLFLTELPPSSSEGYARNLTVLMKLNAKNVIFEALSRCWCYYSKKRIFFLSQNDGYTHTQPNSTALKHVLLTVAGSRGEVASQKEWGRVFYFPPKTTFYMVKIVLKKAHEKLLFSGI